MIPRPSLRIGSVSLADLFSGNLIASDEARITGQLTLPEYQRPYRWDAAQVTELANDLARHFGEQSGLDYYLGSLILHQDARGYLNIIDGQQRITSIGILCLLSQVTPLPEIVYTAPESQQRILANLSALRRQPPVLPDREQLARINVTLVVTDNEDDAYRFFETQNSGGVRLSGIDIAKAYHLRAVPDEQQDAYAKTWESLGNLKPVVEATMRGRFWQSLDWRELASPLRQPHEWRDQVVAELAVATDEEKEDVIYHLAVTPRTDPAPAPSPRTYELRQPLAAGPNSIHYLKHFQDLLCRYCPRQLPEDGQAASGWDALYYGLVATSDASEYLRKLFDAALVLYLSRFGDEALPEAGLWLFRAVYSIRLSNEKMVRESSVQRFVRDTPLLDWIAYSFTHKQLVSRLRQLKCEVSPENLDSANGKKRRHIDAVCRALRFTFDSTATPAHIAERFDQRLCESIDQRLKSQPILAA